MERATHLVIFHLSDPQIYAANLLGIPAAHLIVSWVFSRLPHAHFQKALPRTPVRPNPLYQDLLRVRRWKHLLPDAAPWFRGFAKAKMQSKDADYLMTYVGETRRGELAHWTQWLLVCGFIAWTPFPEAWIIVVYAALSNLPCILNLRYTRQRLIHYLQKASHGA